MKIKKNRKKWFECIKYAFNQIHLVDKCLLVFMTILLVQSAYSLFFHGPVTDEIGHIDVIIRTSAAAIFGYFLSANFIRDVPEPKKDTGRLESSGEIQFQELDEMMKIEKKEERKPSRMPLSNRMQIIIASVIGLFCLIVLILLRDMVVLSDAAEKSASAAATVAQFRDFVSGCVGFLIGCPTHGEEP